MGPIRTNGTMLQVEQRVGTHGLTIDTLQKAGRETMKGDTSTLDYTVSKLAGN